jgi:hypothetical protein
MEAKTKRVLLIGTVLAVGALALRKKKAAPASDLQTVQTPMPSTSGAPMWSPTNQLRVSRAMADAYNRLGRPTPSPAVAHQVAWMGATQVWPSWSWPTNAAQSVLFLTSEDPGRAAWSNTLRMAQNQYGGEQRRPTA